MTITTSLSTEVRERSMSSHAASEHTGLMSEIGGESASIEGHTLLHEQLWFVYDALERGAARLRATASPEVITLLDERLTRLPEIERDLAVLRGPEWREHLAPNPGTRHYVAAIEAAVEAPEYLAHHYTRYLGDLSGGLYIGRNLTKRTGLGADGGDGVRFYEFAEIADARAFKNDYRDKLDALPFNPAERERFVSEVLRAYDLNNEVFAGIDAVRAGA